MVLAPPLVSNDRNERASERPSIPLFLYKNSSFLGTNAFITWGVMYLLSSSIRSSMRYLPMRLPSSAYTWLAISAVGFDSSLMEGILPNKPMLADTISRIPNNNPLKKTHQKIFTPFFIDQRL